MEKDELSDMELSDQEEDATDLKVEEPKLPAQPEIVQDSGLSVREKQGNEILYIVFTTFRKEVEEIAASYNCHIRVGMSSYMITNHDSSRKEEFGRCCVEITNFMNSINFEKLGSFLSLKGNHLSDSVRYNHSPFFSELFKAKGIMLIAFREEVIAFSRKLAKEQIKHEFIATTKDRMIFPVRYNKVPEGKKTFCCEIYREVDKYLEKAIKYYGEFLQERKIVAEVNKAKTFIYLIGERQRYLMESKLTMKNVIESMVCLIIKHTHINDKTLARFLQKASTYPIHFGRTGESQCAIISKDNILKQLINKSPGFFKHIGMDLSSELEGNISANAKIGIFLIRSPTFKTKIQNARNICKDIGYDLFYSLGMHNVNQVFYQEEGEKKAVIRKLLGDIMETIEASKQKFQPMTKIKGPEKEGAEKDENPLTYIMKGGRQIDKNLSQLLRRDVLTEKLQMKKQYNIGFNLIETNETLQYWVLKESGQAGDEVGEGQLKPGRYLRGQKRVGEDGTVGMRYQEIITVI